MSKILDLNDLLEVGREVIPGKEFRDLETELAEAGRNLARSIAWYKKVTLFEVSGKPGFFAVSTPPGFGGLCATLIIKPGKEA